MSPFDYVKEIIECEKGVGTIGTSSDSWMRGAIVRVAHALDGDVVDLESDDCVFGTCNPTAWEHDPEYARHEVIQLFGVLINACQRLRDALGAVCCDLSSVAERFGIKFDEYDVLKKYVDEAYESLENVYSDPDDDDSWVRMEGIEDYKKPLWLNGPTVPQLFHTNYNVVTNETMIEEAAE